MKIKDLRIAINQEKARSAWERGVKAYALDLIDHMDEDATFSYNSFYRKSLLNGADTWGQYSIGGCALIYNSDIAERLCSPSELKRTKNGERRPNQNEDWLDTQTRALTQASSLIMRIVKRSDQI